MKWTKVSESRYERIATNGGLWSLVFRTDAREIVGAPGFTSAVWRFTVNDRLMAEWPGARNKPPLETVRRLTSVWSGDHPPTRMGPGGPQIQMAYGWVDLQ